MFLVSTLTELVATKADELVLLGKQAVYDDGGVLQPTTDCNHPLLVRSAVEALYSLGRPDDLLGISARHLARLHVDSCLKVCTRSPTVDLTPVVDCKAVTGPRCYVNYSYIPEAAYYRRTPSRLVVSLSELAQ